MTGTLDSKSSYKEEVIKSVFHLIYSPTGNSFAYVAKRDGKSFVVKDGIEGSRYDDVRILTYFPDGNSFAYVAKKDGKWFLVKDGVEGNRYDYISNLTYSPAGNSFAYVARKNGKYFKKDGKCFVVRDGVEGNGYDDIYDLTYSSDGNSLAYKATKGLKIFVIKQTCCLSSSESVKDRNNKTNSNYNLAKKCLEIISDTSSTIKNLVSKTEIK